MRELEQLTRGPNVPSPGTKYKRSKNVFAFTSIALTLVPLGTANPTWGDILECCFKAQSSKLVHLFSLKRGRRGVRALSFELSRMSPQVGLAVPNCWTFLHSF